MVGAMIEGTPVRLLSHEGRRQRQKGQADACPSLTLCCPVWGRKSARFELSDLKDFVHAGSVRIVAVHHLPHQLQRLQADVRGLRLPLGWLVRLVQKADD